MYTTITACTWPEGVIHLSATWCLTSISTPFLFDITAMSSEIHEAYEPAVNAPIMTLGPSGRTNTGLLIALTSGLWEQSFFSWSLWVGSHAYHPRNGNHQPKGIDSTYPPALWTSNARITPLPLWTLWGNRHEMQERDSKVWENQGKQELFFFFWHNKLNYKIQWEYLQDAASSLMFIT